MGTYRRAAAAAAAAAAAKRETGKKRRKKRTGGGPVGCKGRRVTTVGFVFSFEKKRKRKKRVKKFQEMILNFWPEIRKIILIFFSTMLGERLSICQLLLNYVGF